MQVNGWLNTRVLYKWGRCMTGMLNALGLGVGSTNIVVVVLGRADNVTPVSDAFWAGIGVFTAFCILGLLDLYLSPTGVPLMIGSYGAPAAPLGSPPLPLETTTGSLSSSLCTSQVPLACCCSAHPTHRC
jgi:hypothetical protein